MTNSRVRVRNIVFAAQMYVNVRRNTVVDTVEELGKLDRSVTVATVLDYAAGLNVEGSEESRRVAAQCNRTVAAPLAAQQRGVSRTSGVITRSGLAASSRPPRLLDAGGEGASPSYRLSPNSEY